MRDPLLATLLSLLATPLVACGATSAAAGDAGADAGECVPVTRVCVTGESGALAPGARVTATRDAEIPHEGTTGPDGCVDLYPESGTWSIVGRTTTNCLNEPAHEHTVTGCGTQTITLAATTCFDG